MTLQRLLLLMLSGWVAISAAPAAADLGSPFHVARVDGLDVQILATPAPFRIGASEWHVLVREADTGSVLLGADVELHARLTRRMRAGHEAHAHLDPAISARLTSAQAGNRLFYASPLDLRYPGQWRAELRVSRAGVTTVIPFEFEVHAARSALFVHWRAFAVAPLGLALFGLHQWRVHRVRRPGRP